MDTSRNHDSLYTLRQAVLRWQLVEDGVAFHTASSVLQPVLAHGKPAMLKVAKCAEERRGAAGMCLWQGEGAAQVFALHGGAVLRNAPCVPCEAKSPLYPHILKSFSAEKNLDC